MNSGPGRASPRAPVHPITRGDLRVVPASAKHADVVATLLGECACQYWRLSAGDYSRTPFAHRRERLAASMAVAPAPGVVALVKEEAVGWCGFGPRSSMERLVRSRTIPKVDDVPVWSIVCYLVRPGYRRQGVARAMLRAVIDYARAAGAPALEAYPVDAGASRIDVTFAYVGTTHLFETEGFRRVVETDARSARLPRWLMRLDL